MIKTRWRKQWINFLFSFPQFNLVNLKLRSSEIWRCSCFVISASNWYLLKNSGKLSLKKWISFFWLGETYDRVFSPTQAHVCLLTHHTPPKSMLILCIVWLIHIFACLSSSLVWVLSLLSSNSYRSWNYIVSTLEAGTHSVSHQFASSSVSRRQWENLSLFVLLLLGNTVYTAPEEGAVPWSHKLAPEMLFITMCFLAQQVDLRSHCALQLHSLERWVGFILFACGLVCRSLLVNCYILEAKICGVEKSISFWLLSPSMHSSWISTAGRSVALSNAVVLLLHLSLVLHSCTNLHTYICILIYQSSKDDVKPSLHCEVSWLLFEQLLLSTEIGQTCFRITES